MKKLFLLLAVFAVAPCHAQPGEVRRISLAAGDSSATVKGSITGDQMVDYTLRGRAGQTMRVTLQTSNASSYFNILPPGSETALFVGSTSGTTWTGILGADGDYTVRVYLMRSAARRKEKANYTLRVVLSGAGPGTAPSGDARVDGTPYHATGKVPCSFGTAPEGPAQCEFGVIRGTPGNAEVHLTSPGGRRRVLRFAGATVTVTDPNVRLEASRRGDEWFISINENEHYTIPEAVIVGG